MTRNQIAYWELQETKRHNSRTEGQKDVELQEFGRHNVAVEGETTRHNVADESIRSGTLSENVRHNRVEESVKQGSLAETVTHNRVVEAESNRHNLATETQAANELRETTRHNVESESINWVNAGANAGRSVGSALGASAGLLIAKGSNSANGANKVVSAIGKNIEQNRSNMVKRTNKVAHNLERAGKQAYKKVTGHDYRQPKVSLDNRHGGSRGGNYNNRGKKGRR